MLTLPPYPSTMNNYDAFYGLYDRMFDKNREHIDYTQKMSFLENIERLIKMLIGKTKYNVLSQNTRVKPEPDEIKMMLSQFGKVIVKEKEHNYQATSKDNKKIQQRIIVYT